MDRRALQGIAPLQADGRHDYSQTFSSADLKLLAEAIIDACDAADGVRDGQIDHWSACRPALERLQCPRGKSASCLTARQVTMIRKIFDSMAPWTAGWPYDTGLTQPAWQDKLSILGVTFPPVAAINILHVFVNVRNAAGRTAAVKRPPVRWAAVLAWVAGSTCGYHSAHGYAHLSGIASVDSILATMVVWLAART